MQADHHRSGSRRAAVLALVALLGSLATVAVPAFTRTAGAAVNPPYVNIETPYEVEDYYAGFDYPETDGPHLLYLHPIGYDGDDWSNQSGQMRIEVAITDPDDNPLALTVTYRLDVGDPVPLPYDLLTGTWHTTIDSTKMQDYSHLLFIKAIDPAGNVTSDGGQFSLYNRPSVENPEGTGWGVVHGLVPVEVIASDPQTPTEDLHVKMGAGLIVSAQGHWEDPAIYTPLTYDPASGHFKGLWNSGEVPDDQLYRLDIVVTDGDGLTQRTARGYAPHNAPHADIWSSLTGGLDGVQQLRFAATSWEGDAGSVTARWQLDGGSWRTTVADPGYPGYRLAALDTVPLANGPHRITLDVEDTPTGRHTVVSKDIQVVHGTGFKVAVTSPVTGSAVAGMVTLDAEAWNGALKNNPVHPSTIWYRVDEPNLSWDKGWVPMQRTSLLDTNSHRFTAQIDLRKLPDGDRTISIAGTDYTGNAAYGLVNLVVGGSKPMTVSPNAPAPGASVSGSVAIVAGVNGGGLDANPPSAVTAWYRVDNGTYRPMVVSGSTITSSWDSAEAAPGEHTIEIVATDWRFTGRATTKVWVAARTGLTLSIVAPVPGSGAGGGRPIAVKARAVSPTRGLSGMSVFARVGTGPFTTFTLGSDGYFRGSLDPGSAAVGHTVVIEVLATDYDKITSATTSYAVR